MSSELINAIAAVARRTGQRGVTIGQVVDPRPASLTVKIIGFTEAVRVIASDLFALTPLQTGDLVVVVPIPSGGWVVIARIGGSEPELSIDAHQVQATFPVVVGEMMEEGQFNPTIQTHRSDLISVPVGDSAYTWQYAPGYFLPPFVIAIMEADDDNAGHLNITVRTGSTTQVVFRVRNTHASAINARVVALAMGEV